MYLSKDEAETLNDRLDIPLNYQISPNTCPVTCEVAGQEDPCAPASGFDSSIDVVEGISLVDDLGWLILQQDEPYQDDHLDTTCSWFVRCSPGDSYDENNSLAFEVERQVEFRNVCELLDNMFSSPSVFTGDADTYDVGAAPVFIDFDAETFSTEASNEDCGITREVVISGLINPAARSYMEGTAV